MIALVKEMVAAFPLTIEGKAPNVKLHATYSLAQGTYRVWKAPNLKALEKAFEQSMPTWKKFTEFCL